MGIISSASLIGQMTIRKNIKVLGTGATLLVTSATLLGTSALLVRSY